MTDAETARMISSRIAAYLTAVHPARPNPDDLAWVIVRALNQSGDRTAALPSDGERPGEQQVLTLPDQDDGARVIVCVGEFDQQTLHPFRAAGLAATADPTIRRVVLDVSRITFADSSMLNEMFRLLRSSRLVLVGPLPHSLARVLELTQAGPLFPTTDSIEAARTL
ncbi:STAS domain-containing protein [Streptomyces sp. NPDC058674]|uniref:STAS domain-containing protein n=1 Tax=Streptomyces sp. NPDC058674 TaxID=3346592 RepID=UPI00365C2EC3